MAETPTAGRSKMTLDLEEASSEYRSVLDMIYSDFTDDVILRALYPNRSQWDRDKSAQQQESIRLKMEEEIVSQCLMIYEAPKTLFLKDVVSRENRSEDKRPKEVDEICIAE